MLRNQRIPRARIPCSTVCTLIHPEVLYCARHAFGWVLLSAQEVTLRIQPNLKDSKIVHKFGIMIDFYVRRIRRPQTCIIVSRNVLHKGVNIKTITLPQRTRICKVKCKFLDAKICIVLVFNINLYFSFFNSNTT